MVFPISQLMIVSFKRFPTLNYNLKNFIIISDKIGYAYRTSAEKWPIEVIVDYIYKDNIWNKKRALIAITPSIPQFNHNNFRFFCAMKNFRLLDFTGLPRDTEEEYFNRIEQSDYIINFEDNITAPDWLNKYNDNLQEKLKSKNFPYIKIEEFITKDNTIINIYKRV